MLKNFEPPLSLDKAAIAELQNEIWPGNIRQLKSFFGAPSYQINKQACYRQKGTGNPWEDP